MSVHTRKHRPPSPWLSDSVCFYWINIIVLHLGIIARTKWSLTFFFLPLHTHGLLSSEYILAKKEPPSSGSGELLSAKLLRDFSGYSFAIEGLSIVYCPHLPKAFIHATRSLILQQTKNIRLSDSFLQHYTTHCSIRHSFIDIVYFSLHQTHNVVCFAEQ